MPFPQGKLTQASWLILKICGCWSPGAASYVKGWYTIKSVAKGYRGLIGENHLHQSTPEKEPDLGGAPWGKTEHISFSFYQMRKFQGRKGMHLKAFAPCLSTQLWQELSRDGLPWCDLTSLSCFPEQHFCKVLFLYLLLRIVSGSFIRKELYYKSRAKIPHVFPIWYIRPVQFWNSYILMFYILEIIL